MTQKSKSKGKTSSKKAASPKKKEKECEACKTIESTGMFPKKKNKGDILIKNLGKSTLVEEDLQHTEKGLVHEEPMELKNNKTPKLFYRNFVFKCNKCVSEFEHEATIPIIEHEITCPVCKEVHVVRVVPVTRHYEFKMPEDLKVIKHAKKKK